VAVVTHPAKFTTAILERAAVMLEARAPEGASVLDPMAGTGKGVDFLRARGYDASGIDLEPVDAWGDKIASEHVVVGNALELDVDDDSLDVIFTSCTYGNRMADRDMRPSVAGTYAKGLGRHATEGSSCHLQWGAAYREFHRAAWAEVRRVLKPGGLFLLNVSDHYRDKRPVPVAAWHLKLLGELCFEWIAAEAVVTPRLRNGANPTRAEVEWLIMAKKVSPCG
jgi:SAM-dependent methyltransferase